MLFTPKKSRLLALGLTLLIMRSAQADVASDAALQQIATNTGNTTTEVKTNIATSNGFLKSLDTTLTGVLTYMTKTLQAYLDAITTDMNNIIAPDDTDTTAAMQVQFSALGNLVNQNLATQIDLQRKLNQDLLGSKVTKENTPYANDLVYSTLLGSPFYSPDPRNPAGTNPPPQNPQYNYIKNASGINFKHTAPQANWQSKSPDDLTDYENYYTSVKAIESFGGYVLSYQYADGNQFNTLQTQLATQATDAKSWTAKIASETVGAVLRQILLYQSQSFVLLTQLVKTQRDMAAAQVMTNTLLIANNRLNEKHTVSLADGTA